MNWACGLVSFVGGPAGTFKAHGIDDPLSSESNQVVNHGRVLYRGHTPSFHGQLAVSLSAHSLSPAMLEPCICVAL